MGHILSCTYIKQLVGVLFDKQESLFQDYLRGLAGPNGFRFEIEGLHIGISVIECMRDFRPGWVKILFISNLTGRKLFIKRYLEIENLPCDITHDELDYVFKDNNKAVVNIRCDLGPVYLGKIFINRNDVDYDLGDYIRIIRESYDTDINNDINTDINIDTNNDTNNNSNNSNDNKENNEADKYNNQRDVEIATDEIKNEETTKKVTINQELKDEEYAKLYDSNDCTDEISRSIEHLNIVDNHAV